LLETKSAIYSSRPWIVMTDELQKWDYLSALAPYGDRHRRLRQYLNRFLHPSVVPSYIPLQTRETHKLLNQLLDTPEKFMHHIRHTTGALTMMMAYGHEVEEHDDPFVALAEEGMKAISESFENIVNIVPWLKYVPAWVPGTGFQKAAEMGRRLSYNMLYKPYELTKANVLNGTARPSMISKMLETNTDTKGNVVNEHDIAAVGAQVYVAASDTVSGTRFIDP